MEGSTGPDWGAWVKLAVGVLLGAIVPIAAVQGLGAATPRAVSPFRLRALSPLPQTPGVTGADLVGSDCPTPVACIAVGTDSSGAAVAATASETEGRWIWAAPEVVAPTGLGALAAIACPTAITCLAVGRSRGVGGSVVATRSAAGWRWTEATALPAGVAGRATLAAVACATASSCVAVGVGQAGTSLAATATSVRGEWHWSPLAPLSADFTVAAVACPTSSECVAVGTNAAGEGVTDVAMPVRSTWVFGQPLELLPDATGDTTLADIACPAPSTCVAVGQDGSGAAVSATGVSTAGGWTWSGAQQLDAGGTPTDATGAACHGDACVLVDGNVALRAVGSFGATSWSTLAVPHPVSGLRFTTVACPLADDCVALGLAPVGRPVATSSLSAPSLPTGVEAVPTDGGALVRWRAPVYDGGTPLGSYVVAAVPGGSTCRLGASAVPLECRVTGLRNGTRYRFVVTAVNGYSRATSTPSAPVTPMRFQPPVPSPLDAAVLAYVASRPGEITVCVDDLLTGQRWTIAPTSVQHTASIVKVEILATLLYDHQESGTPLTAGEQSLATSMIEESDNDAAQQLYVDIGQQPGLVAFDRRIGLTGTTPSWAWGFTDTTALDQTRIVALFAQPNRVLDAASRAYGLGLLRHVDPAQAWGVSSGPPPGVAVALKNGWYPTAPGDWQVNSEGWVIGRGRSYIIAVLTRDNDEMADGVSTIATVSAMVWSRMAPASRGSVHAHAHGRARAR